MRERKETGVHKFNSKQLLSKTLNSRMNIVETRFILESSRAV